jgi:hypothetical protein
MKLKNSGRNKVAQNNKRISALSRLENQLKTGVKTAKNTHVLTAATTGNDVELTESDVIRIKKEISVLKSRIVSDEVALSLRTKKYRGGAVR